MQSKIRPVLWLLSLLFTQWICSGTSITDFYLNGGSKTTLESQLTANPQDPEANYHYIFWELADLVESSEFKTVLSSIGLSSEIFDLTVEMVEADDAVLDTVEFSLNEDFELEDIRSYMLEELLPILDSLEDRFATIGQSDVIELYGETDLEEAVFIDYADSLVFRALAKFLTCMVRIELAYGYYQISAREVAELYYSGILTTEYIRDKYPDFGSVYNSPNVTRSTDNLPKSIPKHPGHAGHETTLLEVASSNLKAAIDFYQEASPLLRSSSRTQGLFLLYQEDLPDEEEFSEVLVELEQTLEGAHSWGDVSDPFQVNLKPFFDGLVDFSVLLPESYGNQYRDMPFPDPTFAGMFPDLNDTQVREFFSEEGLTTSNLWMGIMPVDEDWYWWQGGQWWRSHWFGIFYREAPAGWDEFDYRIFPSEWMFHAWLGWIYPAEATPESVWIWQADSESWLWTNKEIYPVLYDNATGLWIYISLKDGTQYIWQNGEWELLQ